MRSGVYLIINTHNGKFYLGSSKDIQKRWSHHLDRLAKGKHQNIHLQRAWFRYGSSAFSLRFVEHTTDLISREQFYLDLLTPWNPSIGYNIAKQAKGGDNLTQHPHRARIVKKIKQSCLKNNSKLAPDERQKRWARYGTANPNWKGGVSTPICECGKTLLYGHKYCSQCSKIGDRNPFFGKSHSPETKSRLAEKRMGIKPKNSLSVIVLGQRFESCADAARSLGVCPATIHNWIRGKVKNPKCVISPLQNNGI